ncbi:MAG: DUF1127 domain-containing protein [Paracoccaceae bacterium]
MFTRLFARWQMRRSTAYLLSRVDDRMLDDIGLTRTDIEAMHLGLGPDLVLPVLRPGRALPVPFRT